jgi:hypothetical protein|tara:strand:- start:736 stop:960 length:225 start_codon:yes stop_codon:yes gene_type:complete
MLKKFCGPSKKPLRNFLFIQEQLLDLLKAENCLWFESGEPYASKNNQFAILLLNNVSTMNGAWDRLCKEQAHAI